MSASSLSRCWGSPTLRLTHKARFSSSVSSVRTILPPPPTSPPLFIHPTSQKLPSNALLPFSRRPQSQPPSMTQTRPASSNSRWVARQSSDHFAQKAKVMGLKSRAAFKLLELDAKYNLFGRYGGGRPGQSQSQAAVVVDLGYAPGSWSQVAVDRAGPNSIVVGIDLLPARPPKGVSTFQGDFLDPRIQNMVKEFLLETKERKRVEARMKAEMEGETAAAKDNAEGEGESESEKGEKGKEEEGEEEGGGSNRDVVMEQKSYIDSEREVALQREEEAKKAGGKKKNMRIVDVVLSDMSEPWPSTQGFTVNSLSNPYRRLMNTSGIPFKDHASSMDLCYAALSFASDTLKPGGHFVCKFYQGREDGLLEKRLKKMFTKVHREKPESSRSESKEAFFVALKRKADVTYEDI